MKISVSQNSGGKVRLIVGDVLEELNLDGRYLAILGLTVNSNAWMIENF